MSAERDERRARLREHTAKQRQVHAGARPVDEPATTKGNPSGDEPPAASPLDAERRLSSEQPQPDELQRHSGGGEEREAGESPARRQTGEGRQRRARGSRQRSDMLRASASSTSSAGSLSYSLSPVREELMQSGPVSLPPIAQSARQGAVRVPPPLPNSRQRAISPLRAQMRAEAQRTGAVFPGSPGRHEASRSPPRRGEPVALADFGRHTSNYSLDSGRPSWGQGADLPPLPRHTGSRELYPSRDASPLRMRHRIDAGVLKPLTGTRPAGEGLSRGSKLPAPFKVSNTNPWKAPLPSAPASRDTSPIKAPGRLGPSAVADGLPQFKRGVSDSFILAPAVSPKGKGPPRFPKPRFSGAIMPLGTVPAKPPLVDAPLASGAGHTSADGPPTVTATDDTAAVSGALPQQADAPAEAASSPVASFPSSKRSEAMSAISAPAAPPTQPPDSAPGDAAVGGASAARATAPITTGTDSTPRATVAPATAADSQPNCGQSPTSATQPLSAESQEDAVTASSVAAPASAALERGLQRADSATQSEGDEASSAQNAAAAPPPSPMAPALPAPAPCSALSPGPEDTRPLLDRLVAEHLPKVPAGTLQQRADETLMLLRCDWSASDPVAMAAQTVEQSLVFCCRLAELAKQQECLQGTIFQALTSFHAVIERERLEREWAEQDAADAAAVKSTGEWGGEGVSVDGSVDAAAEPGGGANRIMQRSADGSRRTAQDGPLNGLSGSAVLLYAAGAVELRKSLRIKIEDDKDLETARRAFAECGHFVLRLRAEAATRGISETELLRKLEAGEAD